MRKRARGQQDWTFEKQTPGVIFQPVVYEQMQQGIRQMVDAIRPTLGPRPRIVAMQNLIEGKAPELLDCGGIIARRTIELGGDRDADLGAMLVRNLVCRVHDQAGDGSATSAVLFQSIYDLGVRHIVAGGNAMRLRRYFERGLRAILVALGDMTVAVEGKERLAHVAASVCPDEEIARFLGEIFDIIGEYGWLEISAGRGRGLEREYAEGAYWSGGVVSRKMLQGRPGLRVQMENGAILISDLDIQDPRTLVPVLEQAMAAGIRSLLIVAAQFSESVLALLLANQDPDKFQIVAVKSPGLRSDERAWALEDLAALSGGRPLLQAAGNKLDEMKVQDLGRARRIWVDGESFGVIGGGGDPRQLRRHIAEQRAAFDHAKDKDIRQRIQKRLGKLMGGSATLWVGGATAAEIEVRKEMAQRASDLLRGAVREGVVPGGGVCLLSCRPALQQLLDQSTDEDECAAYRILIRAMETPIRTIIANAGFDPSEVMAEVKLAGLGYGFDVNAEQVVDVAQAGIFDVAAAQKAAARTAIIGAALALTVDVVVHRRKVPRSLNP